MRRGAFWQCPHAARPGFKACGTHGAGYPKREKDGTRQNPALAALVTGETAKPETISRLVEAHPELGPLFAARLTSSTMFDPREFLALAQAALDHWVQRANFARFEANLEQGDPPALRAIAAAERIVVLAERCVVLEQKMGPVTRAELERMTHAFSVTLARFVPAEQLESARQFCRTQFLGQQLPAGGEDPAGEGRPA